MNVKFYEVKLDVFIVSNSNQLKISL